MDGVEYLETYTEALTAAEHITAPETKAAVLLILKLLNAMHIHLDELQDTVEEL